MSHDFLDMVKREIDDALAKLSKMSLEELAEHGCIVHRDTGAALTADEARAIWASERVEL